MIQYYKPYIKMKYVPQPTSLHKNIKLIYINTHVETITSMSPMLSGYKLSGNSVICLRRVGA